MRGFPAPPDWSRPGQTDLERMKALEAYLWPDLAHKAVHSTDPFFRGLMARDVAALLMAGAPLPAPVREWLFFVLRSIEQTIPTLAKGRPVDHELQLTRIGKLLGFLRSPRNVAAPVNDMLARAEVELGDWVRKFYYSDAFELYRVTFGPARRNARKNSR
jgi:hypothetical protein